MRKIFIFVVASLLSCYALAQNVLDVVQQTATEKAVDAVKEAAQDATGKAMDTATDAPPSVVAPASESDKESDSK